MAITYQNTLPDPNNPINDVGRAAAGSVGPGYKSVKLSSKSQIMKNRTNSGRLIARSHGSHTWEINITYNPMTRAEFEPIYNFLLQRRGGMDPFYVSLPQYVAPQDSTFATHVASNTVETNGEVAKCIQGNTYIIESLGYGANWTSIGAASETVGEVFTKNGVTVTGYGSVDLAAGTTSMMLDGIGSGDGDPRPGDLFTITDTDDSNHTKAYMVTQVEKNGTADVDYDSLEPDDDERIIHFIPPLAKRVNNNADVIFHNPKIRVILSSDVQEYSLGVDGLYQFSLKLEEAQP